MFTGYIPTLDGFYHLFHMGIVAYLDSAANDVNPNGIQYFGFAFTSVLVNS